MRRANGESLVPATASALELYRLAYGDGGWTKWLQMRKFMRSVQIHGDVIDTVVYITD